MKNIFKILIITLIIFIITNSKGLSESYFDFIYPNIQYSTINNSYSNQLNLSFYISSHSESNDSWFAEELPEPYKKKNIIDENQYEDAFINYFKLGINIRNNGENILKFLPNMNLVDFNVTTNIDYTKQLIYWQIRLINYESELPFKEDFSLINLKLGYGYSFINRLDKYLYTLCGLGLAYTSYELDNSIFKFEKNEQFNKNTSFDPSFYLQMKGLYSFLCLDVKYNQRWFLGTPTVSISDISGRIDFNKRRILDLPGVDSFNRIAINDYTVYLEYQYLKIEQKELIKKLIKLSIGINANIPFL